MGEQQFALGDFKLILVDCRDCLLPLSAASGIRNRQ
jgi:hypothetical protein